MELFTRADSKGMRYLGKAVTTGLMEASMKGVCSKDYDTATANTRTRMMGLSTRGTGRMASETDKARLSTSQGKAQKNHRSRYEGGWKEGLKSGKGKMTYASGNYYEGDWLKDLKNGKGLMVWETAHERYEGEWRDNQ